MTDEAAKELAAAMNRLAAAIEAVTQSDGLGRSIHVRHLDNVYTQASTYQQTQYPFWSGGSIGMRG